MHGNTYAAHWWTSMEQHVVTASKAVELEPGLRQCRNDLAPGNSREGLSYHAQAAIVR
jgi:hypothetical protein